MSDFRVEIVKVVSVETHPNADLLDIAKVWDFPVVVKRGTFRVGDEGLYISIDAHLPERQEWNFLSERERARLRAKKLRGVYSQGLLIPCFCTCGGYGLDIHTEDCMFELPVGTDLREMLGIEKFEPRLHTTFGKMNTDDEPDPGFIPVYTDIESLRRHPNVLEDGETVVMTEKVHGANGRFCWKDDRLWVGSHRRIKKEDVDNLWWKAAIRSDLHLKLQNAPGYVFYGEVYGQVQDLKYGLGDDVRIAMFDAYDTSTHRYLDYTDFKELCSLLDLSVVPVIHLGPWHPRLREEAEGRTIIGGAAHVREGFVVRPIHERTEHMGRVILKMVGEGYNLRKEKD